MITLTSVLLFLFSLGQLGRISFFKQEVNIYLYEAVLGTIVTVLLIRLRKKPLISAWKKFRLLCIFLIYLFISLLISMPLYSAHQNYVAFLYYLRLAFYVVFFFYFYFFTHQSLQWIRVTRIFVMSAFGFIAVTSFMQYFLYPDLTNIFYAGWDPHMYRMVGLFFEPQVSGAVYGLLFFFFLSIPSEKYRVLKIFSLSLLMMLIFLTFSRSTYVGIIAGLTVAVLQYRKYITRAFKKNLKISVVSSAVVLIISLYMASISTGEGANLMRTSTIKSRLVNMQEGIRVWQQNPILGVGYNHIRYAREVKQEDMTKDLSHSDASFHSSFLVILVTGGIIGLVLLFGGLYELSRVSKYGLYSVVFVGFASLADNVLLHPFVMLLWFVTLSVSSHLSGTRQ